MKQMDGNEFAVQFDWRQLLLDWFHLVDWLVDWIKLLTSAIEWIQQSMKPTNETKSRKQQLNPATFELAAQLNFICRF